MGLFDILKNGYESFRIPTDTDPNTPKILRCNDNQVHGVVFGKKDGKTIIKPEDEKKTEGNIAVFGGVGSGKTTCIAIPSLLAWNKRVFAIDIKGDLYENTKDKRPNIKVFNPLDDGALGYNPFHLLDYTDNLAQEATLIANALVPLPTDTKDPFWIKSARNLLTSAILHFYSNEKSFTQTISKILSTQVRELIDEIKANNKEKAKKAKYYINSFIGMDDKTLYGIYMELSNNITLYVTDDILEKSLSNKNYICPADLDGADIYVMIPEYLLEQWKNLLTLMISQFFTHFQKRKDNTGTPILFMLDEFPRLGKIENIIPALTTLRSKKITICIILQSLAQLDLVYGRDSREVINDACSFKAILSATSGETQEYFSKLVGTYERLKESESQTRNWFGFQTSTNDSETKEEKRTIKPENFATLKDVVMLTPFGFFRTNKVPYYKQ